MQIRKGDECLLLDNRDLIKWVIRSPEGIEDTVPSVVFRIPPPDQRLVGYINRLRTQYDRLRKLWLEKHRRVRFNMVLLTIRLVRSWELKQVCNVHKH